MGRSWYAFWNNVLNVLPPHGRALDWRGAWAARHLKSAGKRLRISSLVNIYDPSNVSVGDHVYIGYGCYLGAGSITFEDEVVLGPFCAIAAGNHTKMDGSYRYGPYEHGEIHIGRGTWLGAHVTVTAGVTIGAGCLVAAGAVVTQDVPDGVTVGGVPAKIISEGP